MSRLDELINEFCPDGVEYKAICEFCKVGTGKVIGKMQMKMENTLSMLDLKKFF